MKRTKSCPKGCRPKKSKRAAPKKRQSLTRRLVNQVISRQAEKKTAQVYEPLWGLFSTSSGSWDVNNVRNVGFGATEGFNIQQGTGQGQRIGNKFTIKRMVMRGVVVPFGYDLGTNPNPVPQQVKAVFFRQKGFPTSKPAPKSTFLQLGNASNSLQNDLMDMVAPFNKDTYEICGQRTFKIGLSQFWGDGGSTAPGNAVAGYYSNNDFHYNQTFSVDLAKMLPKTVVYADNANITTSKTIYVAWILCRADGSANPSASIPCHVQYVIDLEYTDL